MATDLPHKHELTRKFLQQRVDHVVDREGGGYTGQNPPPYIAMWVCGCGYKVAYGFMTLEEIQQVKKDKVYLDGQAH